MDPYFLIMLTCVLGELVISALLPQQRLGLTGTSGDPFLCPMISYAGVEMAFLRTIAG
jgi:hypothetical protein